MMANELLSGLVAGCAQRCPAGETRTNEAGETAKIPLVWTWTLTSTLARSHPATPLGVVLSDGRPTCPASEWVDSRSAAVANAVRWPLRVGAAPTAHDTAAVDGDDEVGVVEELGGGVLVALHALTAMVRAAADNAGAAHRARRLPLPISGISVAKSLCKRVSAHRSVERSSIVVSAPTLFWL